MRFLALSALCLALATPARAQSCYGGGQALAAPQALMTQSPVEETTVVTTTTRSYLQSSQALVAPPQASQMPVIPQCSSYRQAAPVVVASRYFDDPCPSRQLAPLVVASRAAADVEHYGYPARGFDTVVGFGGSVINARRGVNIRRNSAAALNSTFGGGGLTINARKVRIRGNR
jgi:hypothetical protein